MEREAVRMEGPRRAVQSLVTCLIVGLFACAVAQPSPRGLVEMAYDRQSELFVLFGGLTGPFDQVGSVVGGTWVFNPATSAWSERFPNPSPPDLLAANLVYDEQSDRIVLWGGADTGFQPNTNVWTYDVDADVWTRLDIDPATGPEHRAGSRMAYDAGEDVIVLYGGQDTTDGSFPQTTWLLDIDALSWTQVDTAEAPPGRFFYGLAYEPARDRVYLWGGGSLIQNTVWAFNTSGGQWTEIPTEPPGPFPQGQLGMVAVPEIEGLLVLGGEMQGNDVLWQFDIDTSTWSELGPVPFDARNRFAIAYAPGYGVLVFGGQVGDTSFSFSDETWLFSVEDETWRRP